MPLEGVHQTIFDIIYIFKVQDTEFDNKNLWNGILASIMFVVHAAVHTTTRHTPAQLIFGRDSILNTHCKANWHLIKKCQQD